MPEFDERYIVTIEEREYDIWVKRSGDMFLLEHQGKIHQVEIDRLSDRKFLLKIDRRSSEVDIAREGENLAIFLEGRDMIGRVEAYNLAELRRQAGAALSAIGDHVIRAPMPGLILSIGVKSGDTVPKGTPLLIIEAMKMENVIRAPHEGTVREVFAASGRAVEKDEKLLQLE